MQWPFPAPTILILLLSTWLPPSLTQPIKIGMTAPMNTDGGRLNAAGLLFALEEANRAGGIMARNLSLITLDDDYNVSRTLANVRTLVDTEGVLLLAGMVGSENVAAAKPFVLDRGVPLVGAVSGSAEIRTPFRREFVNVRVSNADEMVAHALFNVQYGRVRRIACLYQNDSFGVGSLAALRAALANAGMQLVATGAYTRGTTDVTAAVEAIAGAAQPAQAVIMAAVQDAVAQFLNVFTADPRTDPNCMFSLSSRAWGTDFPTQVPAALWWRIYFIFLVPMPGDPSLAITTNFSAAYTAAGHVAEPLAFEGYITGRLIVDVLRRMRTPTPTRAAFLDQVYNDRLFVLDDLVLGLYSTNYPGCEQALCACNAGLRSVFAAQLDPATRALGPTLASLRYSVLQCKNPVTNVIAPLLFGQLLPTTDGGWYDVAVEVGRGVQQAFAEANAAGGAGGRQFVLLQGNYSTDASGAMGRLSNLYPLVGMLGSVVPDIATLPATAALPLFGTVAMQPQAGDAPFVRPDVRLQPATSLELMALARWAVLNCPSVHLRSPASAAGQRLLATMTNSIHSFQHVATSSEVYLLAADALSSARTGCVLAVGSDADLADWYAALPGYPALRLLTLSGPAMRLMASLPNANGTSQASRLLFPTPMINRWNTTLSSPDPSEAWKYGYILGRATVQTLIHSEYGTRSYTTPRELLDAWYTVRVMTVGDLLVGPYFGADCVEGQTECECAEGTRAVAVRSVASSVVQDVYSITTCHVVYTPLLDASGRDMVPTIVGVVASVAGCAVLAALLAYRLARRGHAAAPKDPRQPFCVLFTDIQASTHLWAVAPDVMASALTVHHSIIRGLLSHHGCYEVKTIGDSFMCAARSPHRALELALAIQTSLHATAWGTTALDAAYYDLLDHVPGQVSRACWNGLRVRVGVHYGLGDIQLDPVTNRYDYYGTVVNIAARIESVCHGGQTGVSQAVHDAVAADLPDVVWADLGTQPLRGLAEPVRLYQALPAGPLAARTFPALRLHKQDSQSDAMEAELELVLFPQPSVPATSGRVSTVAPTPSVVSTAANWHWVETHPLVLRGEVGPEDLKRQFAVVYSALSTLLTTQAERAREQIVHSLCERLHVPHYGAKGATLQQTLQGLTHRVLPAAVVNARQLLQREALPRQDSKQSTADSASTLHVDSFRHP